MKVSLGLRRRPSTEQVPTFPKGCCVRISSFEFENTQKKWRFMPVNLADLTLLVGVSGVGKSRVLKSIASLVGIAEGRSRPGHKWSISFVDEALRHCTWAGEFEALEEVDLIPEQFDFVFAGDEGEQERRKARIVSERVEIDGVVVVSRDFDQILLNGSKMPKLSSFESAVSLFKEEDLMAPLFKSFQRIIFSDRTEMDGFLRSFAILNPERSLKRHDTIESIRQSSLPPLGKLYLANKIESPVFDEIKDKLISVFPSIEDLGFGAYEERERAVFFAGSPYIQIKESGVDGFIAQSDISSGMLRTISHLAELFLSPPGTVILIDEFENSLGVNCIDAVTEDLLSSSSSIQFIITSHHPYIINNVGTSYWKVICRRGSVVSAVDAEEMGIGVSSHDAFLQLMNSPEYLGGVSCSERSP